MSEHLMFDKLFDKLEKMDDKLDASDTKIEKVVTTLESMTKRVDHLEKEAKECNKRHSQIQGGVAVAIALGLTGLVSKFFGLT